MSKSWEDIFPNVVINKLPREVSDHNPLILTTDTTQPLKRMSFHFEIAWLVQPDFIDAVRVGWEKPCYATSTLDKFYLLTLLCSGFNIQGRRKKCKSEIQSLLKELEEEEEHRPLSFSNLILRTNLVTKLMNILEEEELHWFKRSHETWLHKGDNNTDYFHRIANGRKRKKIQFSPCKMNPRSMQPNTIKCSLDQLIIETFP